MIRKTREPSSSSPSTAATYPCRVVQTDNISLRHCVALHSHTPPSLCQGPAHDLSRGTCTSKLGSTRPVQEPSEEYLGSPVRQRLKLGSNKKLGSRSLADGHKSPIGRPVGIRHSRDVATRFRLSRLDRRSLCGPPDPRPGPAASEISQLRYSGGLQSIKNGTNDQKLSVLGRATDSS